MLHTAQNGYHEEAALYEEQLFAETPFFDPGLHEQEEAAQEQPASEMFLGNWEFSTPFAPGESFEAGESEETAPEVAAFSEVVAEMKDALFRESLEQLADEALDAHPGQLAGEYGDRETHDAEAERVLNEHLEPLAAQAEAMLDRFFEHLEGYEAESLTDTEIDRISQEVLPVGTPASPASEQFLGGLLRKAGKLVSGAVNLAKKGVAGTVKLAGKGLAAAGKFVLLPLLKPLKGLGRFLLRHVVKYALNQLPPMARPFAERLLQKLQGGQKHEVEFEEHEEHEGEAQPSAADVGRLEAEFDVHAAQLLFASEESEIDHLVASYGEGEGGSSALHELEDARAALIHELSRLQPSQSAQPVMEQFAAALVWPAVKTAITLIGRPKVVKFVGGLLGKLIQPLIGATGASALGPTMADIGLRLFGFEANEAQPRAMLAEALAATAEETLNTVAQLPPHVLDNETLLAEAVQEAFENAAASYVPNFAIKPELRESTEPHGMWARKPAGSEKKGYAKYSDGIPVEISPHTAKRVETFGGAKLDDHLKDHHGVRDGQTFKGKVSVYQALPGTKASAIARAEGFHPSHLHPLTPHAAGALLGQNSGLGARPTPPHGLSSPHKLHVNQRLYRIHPPAGHHRHHHGHRIHSELLINLQRGEIRIWLYLNEQACQRVSAELAKPNNAPLVFRRLKPLLLRTSEALKLALVHRHLPPEILVVSETPNLNHKVPHWLKHAGHRFAAKIAEWSQIQLAQYLRNNAAEFKKACTAHHRGVTLRITMTRVPGMRDLLLLSQGKTPKEISEPGWPKGSPAFQVIALSGHAINRLRN